ncbi:MAG: CDP-alcohol phosphatidyltransferase family protein [Jatrophihabitantaceae bacterium]
MRAVHTGPVIGLTALLALLAALAGTVGLGGYGWAVGVSCGLIASAALARSLARHGVDRLGSADRVTLSRAVLAGGVAAVTADSFGHAAPVAALVTLAVLALVLDGVDGWVARRTGTASAFGARFDLEVDAFLILALSGYVARSAGAWVLAIGLARYAFVAAGWRLTWLSRPAPPRHWCRVVAAVQGVVLTWVAADVAPNWLNVAALSVSLALLAESFGREALWKWRHRDGELGRLVVGPPRCHPARRTGPSRVTGNRSTRQAAAAVITVLAFLLVWFALVAPNELDRLTPAAFLRLPAEGLLLAVAALVLPSPARRVVAVLAGVLLGALTVLKALDIGFFQALDRPFHPVLDRSYFGSAAGLVSDSIGRRDAIVVLVAGGALALVVLVLMPLAVLRLSRLVAGHRTASARVVTAMAMAWLLCAVLGVQLASGAPVASTSAAGLAWDRAGQVRADLSDQHAFAKAVTLDPLRGVPADQLLTGLRGKDVLFAFVESYGRVAVQDSASSPRIEAVLDAGTSRLAAAGFCSRSAFLTSPTFGGISWLAHSTLQSGLWIDNQLRYDDLMASDRGTLSTAFKRAGWRTVSDVPSNDQDWPQARSFYHYDKTYDARNVGYAGPKFSYAAMPDQYTLAALQRRELAVADRAPVMAEIDLVSSHTPWAPLPRLVDWGKVGDGSVFDGMAQQGQSPEVVWRDPTQVRAAYGRSIEYSLDTLVSFVQAYPDDDLVLIVLGDHQPATIVSGSGASRDVPITIIAHDPAVLDQIAGWGWQNGMRPGRDAPVWPMDAFRDRFLTAYGPQPPSSTSVLPDGQRSAACGR